MWDNQPSLYYEKTEENPIVEYDSWWEIVINPVLKKEMVLEFPWESIKFETRIQALKYQRDNKEPFPYLWNNTVIICKSKEKK
jgi:hypothetical protein